MSTLAIGGIQLFGFLSFGGTLGLWPCFLEVDPVPPSLTLVSLALRAGVTGSGCYSSPSTRAAFGVGLGGMVIVALLLGILVCGRQICTCMEDERIDTLKYVLPYTLSNMVGDSDEQDELVGPRSRRDLSSSTVVRLTCLLSNDVRSSTLYQGRGVELREVP